MVRLSDEYRYYILENKTSFHPKVLKEVPLEELETKLNWDDLVLDYQTSESLEEIRSWINYQSDLKSLKGIKKKIKQGFRVLFYGSPGTGKSATAALLGKQFKLPVFRVDLSKTVSKYIGETEKNLSKIFDLAEDRNWILFFDEADAIFGKRSATSDAKDRYANQEVSYLLQRIENYNGLIILATNLKNNIDEAFYRRFQSVVNFPTPGPELRLELWQKCFEDTLPLEEDIEWDYIASNFELSGGSIINVVQTSVITTMSSDKEKITEEVIVDAIRKEYEKFGRSFAKSRRMPY